MSSRRRLLLVVIFLVVLFSVSQVGASSVEYIDYTENFVDNANDDNSPTQIGTHNVFADLQDYGANYDQMQEADTGGSGGSEEWYGTSAVDALGCFTNDDNTWDADTATYADYTLAMADAYPAIYVTGYGTGGTGTITQVDIIVRMSVAGIVNDQWGITLDVGASTGNVLDDMSAVNYALANNTFTDVSEPNDASWSWTDVQAIQVHFDTEKITSSDVITIYIYEIVVIVTISGAANYELDLEIGWEAADYDESNEWLCIYPVTGGGWPSEDLKVDVWTGSWTNVFADLTPDQWNNVSIGSYLTDATFEMRFLGGTETGDTTQDTFEIDAVLIKTYSFAYTEDVFENIPLSDSSSVSAGRSVTVNEVIPLSDSSSVSAGFGVVVNELIGFYDSVVVAMDAVLTIFEQIAFTESVAVGSNFVLIILESLGLAVSVVVTKGVGGIDYFVTVFEVIGASDSIQTTLSASVVVRETIGMSEVTQTAMSAYVTILETIGLTDSITAFRGFSVTVFEIIELSESIATTQITHYYVYEVFGVIDSIGVVGGAIPTAPTGSMFYQLFFSLDMWGYIGPLALVIIGYIVASKDKNLGVLWFVLESLVIANYLTLVAETPDYWWHIFILLIGCMSTLMYSLGDRW